MQRSPAAGVAAALARTRAGRALRHPPNWIQLLQFSVVGATGYVVNLAVFSVLVLWLDLDHRLAAMGSFLVAVTNNYTWNHLWTFKGHGGRVTHRGARFFIVALLALGANLIVLEALIRLGLGEIPAQAIAIIVVTPINFIGNKLWTFRRKH
jgi:dolichol-phosphate mannosyltransferase